MNLIFTVYFPFQLIKVTNDVGLNCSFNIFYKDIKLAKNKLEYAAGERLEISQTSL